MKLKILSVVLVVLVSASWFTLKSQMDFILNSRSRAYEKWQWPEECETIFSTMSIEGTGLQAFELGQGAQLLEVLCAMGAYQSSHAYMRLSRDGSAELLQFPLYENYEVWGLPYYDKTTRELTVSYRESSGDICRALRVYNFESSQPQLVREEPLCIQE